MNLFKFVGKMKDFIYTAIVVEFLEKIAGISESA